MVENQRPIPSKLSNRGPGERLGPKELSILKDLFMQNVGVITTSEEIHVNVKTVRKYFKKWKIDLLQSVDKNFIERQEIARERALLSVDGVILNVLKHMKKIDEKTVDFENNVKIRTEKGETNFQTVNFFLENKRIELNKFYVELIDLKARVEMAPTADQIIEQEIKELIEKRNMSEQQLLF